MMCRKSTFVNSQVLSRLVTFRQAWRTITEPQMTYWKSMINSPLPKLRTLAERLVWARNQRGWTQIELATFSGVSRDVIAKTELGTTSMPRQIKKLARVLEVEPAWLAFGSEKIAEWDEETLDIAQQFHDLPESVR